MINRNALLDSLKQKAHVYYFVIWFCVGIGLGVFLSLFLHGQILSSLSILFAGLLLGFIGFSKRMRWCFALVVLSGLLIGLYRGAEYQQSKNNFQQYINRQVSLSGRIVDDVSYGKNGDLRFKVDQVRIDDQSKMGEVWVSVDYDGVLKRSDIVKIDGVMREGFGGFFASLPKGDVVSVTKNSQNDYGLVFRDKFAEKTADYIDEPDRALGLGFLLGQKNELPEDLQEKIKVLGLAHVVVASGYNLTILVAFGRKLFVGISKYLSTLIGGLLIAGFIAITGFSASMSRAGLVAGLSLLAWYYGRKTHPVALLMISIALTLLYKPSYIYGDLGWYLSFLSFSGILILAPLLHKYFWGEKKPSWFRELIVATFSAQIMTLPILIWSFGYFSYYALLANALILGVVPFAMLGVFISGLVGLFVPILAPVLSILAVFTLKYCVFVIDKIASLPGVVKEFEISFSQMMFAYLVLILIILVIKHRTKHNFLDDQMIIE